MDAGTTQWAGAGTAQSFANASKAKDILATGSQGRFYRFSKTDRAGLFIDSF
jgi:hypothetical protein